MWEIVRLLLAVDCAFWTLDLAAFVCFVVAMPVATPFRSWRDVHPRRYPAGKPAINSELVFRCSAAIEGQAMPLVLSRPPRPKQVDNPVARAAARVSPSSGAS
jgi:hypothetical protein